jgi:hypothetical protein
VFHSDAGQPTHVTQLGCQRIHAPAESSPHKGRVEAQQPRRRSTSN